MAGGVAVLAWSRRRPWLRRGSRRGSWMGRRPPVLFARVRRVVAAPRARGCGEWRDEKQEAERARPPRPFGWLAARLVWQDGRRTAGPVCGRPGLVRPAGGFGLAGMGDGLVWPVAR